MSRSRCPRGKVPFRRFEYTYDSKQRRYYKEECLQLSRIDFDRDSPFKIIYLDDEEFKATFRYKDLRNGHIIFETLNGYMEAHMLKRNFDKMMKKYRPDINNLRGVWRFKRGSTNGTRPSWSLILIKVLENEDV